MLCSAPRTFSNNECYTWKFHLIVWEGKAGAETELLVSEVPSVAASLWWLTTWSAVIEYLRWWRARDQFCTYSICLSQHRCPLCALRFPPIRALYAWTVQTLSFCWGSPQHRRTVNKKKFLALIIRIRTQGQFSTLVVLFYFSIIYLRVCVDVMGYVHELTDLNH